jgi:hypothetical protein
MISFFFPFLEISSSNEESSYSLEKEHPFIFLPLAFALSLLFLAVNFSSILMRSSKEGPPEAPDLSSS